MEHFERLLAYLDIHLLLPADMKSLLVYIRMLLIAVIVLTAPVIGLSDSIPNRYSLWGGWVPTVNRASFNSLPGYATCCDAFTNSVGSGFWIGAGIAVPIGSNLFWDNQILYGQHTSPFEDRQPVTVISGMVRADGYLEQRLNVAFNLMGIETGVTYAFSNFIHAGVSIVAGIRTGSTFDGYERLSDGTPGTFVAPDGTSTNSRIRNVANGPIDALNGGQVSITPTIYFNLPITGDSSVLLVPRIQYEYALLKMAPALNWYADNLRIGIGVVFSPKREVIDTMATPAAPPVHTLPAPSLPTPRIATVTPILNISAVDRTGVKSPVEKIVFEELATESISSLLPFIFFREGQDTLGHRYKLTRDFADSMLTSGSALDIYYNILNIVGSRLQRHPDATITLTGCIQPDSLGEPEFGDLSHRRGESVKNALVRQFSIDPGRINIVGRTYPENRSNPRTELGREENRRVEIASSDPAILDLVYVRDTTRSMNVPTLEIDSKVVADTTVDHWSIRIRLNDELLFTNKGSGMPPPKVIWDVERNISQLPVTGDSLHVELTVTSADGQIRTDRRSVGVEHLTLRRKAELLQGDKRIEEYGLILFAFGKAETGDANDKITTLIKRRMEPASRAFVSGHTDITGSPEINLRLSRQRAGVIGDALGSNVVRSEGYGIQNMPFTNDLPEGRFYNRTVRVRVETPVNR